MKKEYIVIVFAVLLFGVFGFFLGRMVYTPILDQKTNCIEKEEPKKEEIEKPKEEIPEYDETSVDDTPIQRTKTSLKEVTSSYCKNMVSKLDFSVVKNMYCCLDLCTKDANDAISYSRYDLDENILHDIYNLKLSNGKILVIKNGVTSGKYYLGGINNIKAFRAVMDVSYGQMYLYVLDNKNVVYEYLVDDEWKNATDKKVVYKNVKDFDIFEGSLYEKCSNRTEGQDITIALHTTSGKTLFGRP